MAPPTMGGFRQTGWLQCSLGDDPKNGELVRIQQAVLGTPAGRPGRLAEELGIPVARLGGRLVELFGLDIRELHRLQDGGIV